MSGFAFPLEPVLEHRRRVERDRQTAVAALEAGRLDAEARIRAVQDDMVLERLEMHRRLSPGAGLAIGEVRMQAGASFRLVARLQQEVLRLAEVRARLETARRELLAATTARKAVELLRQRRFERWRREQARREAAALDEIAVMRAARGGEP